MGLLAAARGLDKLDATRKAEVDSTIAALADLTMTVVLLPRRRGMKSLPVHLLEDFHTVGGGYPDDADRLRRPHKAGDRSPRKDPDVTFRQYLEDARFGVILCGNRSELRLCKTALEQPKWGVWFGRKCCLPAAPVFVALEPQFSAVWTALLRRAEWPVNSAIEAFDRLCELHPDEEAPDLESAKGWNVHVDTWNDHPVRFGPENQDRVFRPRRIVEIRADRELHTPHSE